MSRSLIPKHNKYPNEPELIIDFHGKTTSECKHILEEILSEEEYSHIRVIVGKGTKSESGPVLPYFVKNFLDARHIRHSPSKLQHGGEGAIEVFLK